MSVFVTAAIFIKQEKIDEALPILKELVVATNKEKGCLRYELIEDNAHKGGYVFMEEWASQPDLDAHEKSPHFLSCFPKLRELFAKDPLIIKGPKKF